MENIYFLFKRLYCFCSVCDLEIRDIYFILKWYTDFTPFLLGKYLSVLQKFYKRTRKYFYFVIAFLLRFYSENTWVFVRNFENKKYLILKLSYIYYSNNSTCLCISGAVSYGNSRLRSFVSKMQICVWKRRCSKIHAWCLNGLGNT